MDFLEQAKQVAEKAIQLHASVYQDQTDKETAWLVEADGELSRTNGVDPDLSGVQAFVVCAKGMNKRVDDSETEDPEFLEKMDRMAEATEREYAGGRNPYMVKRVVVVVCRTDEGQIQKSATGMWDQAEAAPSDGRPTILILNGRIILVEVMFRESEVSG